MDKRISKFKKTIKEQAPVVFCVKCGSTHVDQNSIDRIRCYECGNEIPWDAARFSIARNQSIRDVAQAVARGKHGSQSDERRSGK